MFDSKFISRLSIGDFNDNGKIVNSKMSDGFTTVMVYADWCGHCNTAKPIYNDLGKACCCQVQCAVIDSDANAKLLERLNSVGITVDGFPTFLQFKDGKYHRTFEDSYSNKVALRNFIMGV